MGKPKLIKHLNIYININVWGSCIRILLFAECTFRDFVCNDGDVMQLSVPYNKGVILKTRYCLTGFPCLIHHGNNWAINHLSWRTGKV